MNNTMVKVLISVLGSGLVGGLTYAASLFPDWGQILAYITLAISGIMVKLIGWPPKTEV